VTDYEFYEQPENREPAGPPVKRTREPRLTDHVPVRFPAETIAKVKSVAAEDGVTVSTWIRRVVEQELRRRLRPSATSGGRAITLVDSGGPREVSTNSGARTVMKPIPAA